MTGSLLWGVGAPAFLGWLLSAPLEEEEGWCRTLAVSWGVGAGALALTLFWLSLAGAAPRPAAVAAALAVLGLALRLKRLRLPPRPEPLTPVSGALCGLVALALARVWLEAAALPLAEWDSRATWGFKAQALFHGTLRGSAFFHDPSKAFTQPDYPLLVPFLESWVCRGLGRWDDAHLLPLFAAFFTALVLLFYAEVRRHAGRDAALGWTFLFAALGRLQMWAAAGYADAAFAFFLAGTAFAAVRWLEGGGARPLACAVVFGAAMVFTKQEGLVMAALLALLLAAWARRHPEGRRPLAAAMAAGLLVSTPWLIYRHGLFSWHLANEGGVALRPERLPAILRGLAAEALDPRFWGLYWPVLAAASWAAWRRGVWRGPAVWLPGGLVLGHLACLTAMFLAHPWEPAQSLVTGLDRLLLQTATLGLCVAAVLCRRLSGAAAA